MSAADYPDRVGIDDLSRILKRAQNTIRGWDRDEVLPLKLRPQRDERDRRYWTAGQIDGLIEWCARYSRPGLLKRRLKR